MNDLEFRQVVDAQMQDGETVIRLRGNREQPVDVFLDGFVREGAGRTLGREGRAHRVVRPVRPAGPMHQFGFYQDSQFDEDVPCLAVEGPRLLIDDTQDADRLACRSTDSATGIEAHVRMTGNQ